MLPFWRRCGAPIPAFDFSVPGVTSISMDFHKYAYAAKPASILLWRNKELRKYQIFAGANWTGYSVVNPTILSTKSGGPYAACWALLHYMGEEGYMRFAQRMIDGTRRVIEGLREIPGVRILGEPDFCMVAFTTDGFSVFPVADLMRERKWFIQPQLGFNGSEPNIHLSIDQSTIDIVEPFLKDLRDCIETARGMAVNAPPELKAALEQIDPERLDRQTFLALMDQAGMAGDDLPEGGTAGVNEILNSAPPALTGAILKAYMNELYVQPKRTPAEAA
jgi:hypothetical protein